MEENEGNTKNNSMVVVLFQIGDIVCGMNIDDIQEIKMVSEITTVHHAPEYVRGVINLRGQIVTIIDVRNRFRLEVKPDEQSHHVIIVSKGGELIGLLVDDVNDAIQVENENLQPPPANVGVIEGYYFTALYKTDTMLVSIIDKNKVIEEQEAIVEEN